MTDATADWAEEDTDDSVDSVDSVDDLAAKCEEAETGAAAMDAGSISAEDEEGVDEEDEDAAGPVWTLARRPLTERMKGLEDGLE